tara:strand:- start:14386 stop:15882 length:1497 start_codon:yes stop_codon:yes gene_type:complete
MAYTINRYNNATLSTVEDGTLDQTTDLKLVGKNYAGYGEIQNENFVFLLENFSGANAPPKAISGQMWFDSGNSKLKFYDGTKWRTTGGAEVSASAPTGLKAGDFWWDTGNEQLYAYNGTDFILIGPQDAGSGITQMQSKTVRDDGGTNRSIIAATVNDEVIFTISAIQFTIDSTDAENAISGFDVIRRGLTLKNTQNSADGVTTTGHRFHGTATNSEKLGGIDASNFVQTGLAAFTTLTSFADIGIAIGDSSDLKIKIINDNEASIANDVGKTIKLSAKPLSGTTENILRVQADATLAVLPGLAGDGTTVQTVQLGSTTAAFNNVFATTFTGTATQANTIQVDGGSYRQASVSTTLPNTIPCRNSSGNITANVFDGVATSSRFADLAEKYTTEEDLPEGTAVAVGGQAEVRNAKASDICIGVVSTDPGMMMNSEAEGQYIALKGRVPVRVKGIVEKGQAIYAWEDGVCSTIQATAMVGVALESSDDESEKLIECVLKV